MKSRYFEMMVQGRLLSHLGVQLYQTRPAAIAELVANAWDACATKCYITIPATPSDYSMPGATVTVDDDGTGMAESDVETKYLKLSRNRRTEDKGTVRRQVGKRTIVRNVLGRKGIGKLAGFGIAKVVKVDTWNDNKGATQFVMNSEELELPGGESKRVMIPGKVGMPIPDLGFESGTRVTLEHLNAATHLDPEKLRESLARRFSRKVFGGMTVTVNGEPIGDPPEWSNLSLREPEDGFAAAILEDGHKIRYWLGFREETIKPLDASGIVVLVRGKVAQATPFAFFAETGTKQFSFRYLTGVVEADYLDAGVNETPEESDVISTDRQKIRWDHARAKSLLDWGDKNIRAFVKRWNGPSGESVTNLLETDENLAGRVSQLDATSRAKVQRMAKIVAVTDTSEARASELMDTIVRAFEFRQFYDVISDIESKADDPDQFVNMIESLRNWQVLESRALKEIVEGRLKIIDHFETMLVKNAPERAGKIGAESLHDLLADHPWLLNPDYVILAEEKKLRNTLLENEKIDKKDNRRIDFLALHFETERLVVIEIKAPGHAVEFDELQRLHGYLKTYRSAKFERVEGVLVANEFNVDKNTLREYKSIFTIRKWKDVFNSARKFYEHYRAILDHDVDSQHFEKHRLEIGRLRHTLEKGAVRNPDRNLGAQDISLSPPKGIVVGSKKKTSKKSASKKAGPAFSKKAPANKKKSKRPKST